MRAPSALNSAWWSRKRAVSRVQMGVKARGKKYSTTTEPRSSDRLDLRPSEPSALKSGATSPTLSMAAP